MHIRDHIALHDFHAFLILLSVSERTVLTADHSFCRLCPQAVLPSTVPPRRLSSFLLSDGRFGIPSQFVHPDAVAQRGRSDTSAHLQFPIPSTQPHI